ncbi:hypothetical protein [Streptomyces sp. NPDC013181]|uniref:hypothetical protein n=1 Tax=Streptomyces sp. NPDC013181 TaxID=3364864 RepID=UPI00369CB2D6
MQTSVMAFRLVMAIADAVRRHQQKKARREAVLPPAETASVEAREELEKHLLPDIATALVQGADWPQLAQQLIALRDAGVDLETMLPRVGEITVTVRDAVAPNAERIAREGTDPWAAMLRETMPAGSVREVILASPAWPEMAAKMASLDKRGVDVRRVLAATYEEGVGVDQAVSKVLSTTSMPTTSRDAKLSYGPLTIGLDIPPNLELGNRAYALHHQLAITPSENQRYVRMVRAAMPGLEREADLLVADRHWPLLAARIERMERDGQPVAVHLERLGRDSRWREGSPSRMGERLVRSASDALTTRLGSETVPRVAVNTTAARATSSSVGPTRAAKAAAPAEAAVSTRGETAAPARGKRK